MFPRLFHRQILYRKRNCLWVNLLPKISSKFHFISCEKKPYQKQFYAYFMNFSSLTLKRKLYGVHQKFLKFFIKITLTLFLLFSVISKPIYHMILCMQLTLSFRWIEIDWTSDRRRRQMPKGANGCEWSSWLTCHLDQICFSQNFCFLNFCYEKKKVYFLYFKFKGYWFWNWNTVQEIEQQW